MKKYLATATKFTLVFIVLLSIIYPLLIAAVAVLAPGGGKGQQLMAAGKVVGYANVGQKFTADKYFWGRPSAVDYNAAASGGSNKAGSNAEYIKQVEARIDSFLVHNPQVTREQIPAELVTASGSGLDPDLSPAGAYIQVARVAASRGFATDQLHQLVDRSVEKPLLGLFGPAKVNVLKLNIALDALK